MVNNIGTAKLTTCLLVGLHSNTGETTWPESN